MNIHVANKNLKKILLKASKIKDDIWNKYKVIPKVCIIVVGDDIDSGADVHAVAKKNSNVRLR